MVNFKIVPLPADLADDVRRRRKDAWGNTDLRAVVADRKPGYPCRVCLEDAEPGEPMLLFSYRPFAAAGPYQNLGPIFIHERACTPYAGEGVPEQLRARLLSLRAYDARDQMLDADVTDGGALEATVEHLFADPRALHIHVHNARPGCFACVIERR